MEGADRIRATAHAGDHAIRQMPGALEHLRARLATDHGLQFAHEIGIGMRTDAPSPGSRTCSSGSATQSRKASSMAARSVRSPLVTGTTVGAHEPHAAHVRRLPLHVDFAHVHRAGQTDARARGGSGHTMLAGAGLRHDALRTHALGHQRLTERVVDLVRAGVREILALEPDLRTPALRQVAHRRAAPWDVPPSRAARQRVRRGTSLRRQDVAHRVVRGGRTRAPASRECSGRRRDRSGHRASGSLPASSSASSDRGLGLVHCSCHVTFSTQSLRAKAARARDTKDSISCGILAAGRFFHAARHIHAEGPHRGDGFCTRSQATGRRRG